MVEDELLVLEDTELETLEDTLELTETEDDEGTSFVPCAKAKDGSNNDALSAIAVTLWMERIRKGGRRIKRIDTNT